MKNIGYIFLTATLLTLILNGSFASLNDDEIIATVNGENIYLSEFNRLFNAQKNTLKNKLIQDMIDEKLILQEAKARNLQLSEDEVIKQIDLLKEKHGGEDGFNKFLNENNATIENAKNEIRNQMFYQLTKNNILNENTDLKSFLLNKRQNSNILVFEEINAIPKINITNPEPSILINNRLNELSKQVEELKIRIEQRKLKNIKK